MIFFKEFIWYDDHYVYHITEKKNMDSIITKGLKPMLGERSLSVGDNEKSIYFFDDFNTVEDWMDALFAGKDKNGLEVLRFNLKRRKWYMHDSGREDFYLKNKVLPDKLDYLTTYDKDGNLIDFQHVFGGYFDGKYYRSYFNRYEDVDCRWQKLKQYKLFGD